MTTTHKTKKSENSAGKSIQFERLNSYPILDKKNNFQTTFEQVSSPELAGVAVPSYTTTVKGQSVCIQYIYKLNAEKTLFTTNLNISNKDSFSKNPADRMAHSAAALHTLETNLYHFTINFDEIESDNFTALQHQINQGGAAAKRAKEVVENRYKKPINRKLKELSKHFIYVFDNRINDAGQNIIHIHGIIASQATEEAVRLTSEKIGKNLRAKGKPRPDRQVAVGHAYFAPTFLDYALGEKQSKKRESNKVFAKNFQRVFISRSAKELGANLFDVLHNEQKQVNTITESTNTDKAQNKAHTAVLLPNPITSQEKQEKTPPEALQEAKPLSLTERVKAAIKRRHEEAVKLRDEFSSLGIHLYRN